MKTWYACYVASSIIMELILILSDIGNVGWYEMMTGICFCGVCIWKLAPCVHPNHPMEPERIKKCGRRAKEYYILISCLAIILKLAGVNTGAMLCFSAESLCLLLLVMGCLAGNQHSEKPAL